MDYKILDVGCGSLKGHHPILESRTLRIDIQKTRFNRSYLHVQCSAEYLPFKSSSFEMVVLSHVLEHVEDPIKTLKEAIRVSKKIVKIRVPHRFSKDARIEQHKRVFTRKWFQKTLNKYNFSIRTTYEPRFLFLNFPSELEVVIYK